MLKIEKLIEDEEIYEAKELSKQLEEKINQLGEEKEKEKEFLLQKLEPFTTKIDNIIITQFFEDPNIELKEEGTREELDLFTNLLKIEDLITQNKLDEAQEYLDKNKRKINQLDEEEKKKEKEFLIKKITKMEQTLEKIKETSKKYKIKKYLQEKKEQLTNIFKKEDE